MSDQHPTGRAGPLSLELDEERLTLVGAFDADGVYDLLLNGGHVWSLQPSRDAKGQPGRMSARWPQALRPYLRGHATVELRDHAGVLTRVDHVFGGDGSREVSVTGRDGQPLILDKWGRLIRPLATEDQGLIDELMDLVERLLDDLRDKAGVPGFVCYGTLLGAIRDGRLIGHDNDVDLAYVSEHPHPVDVVREAYRVERALIDAGWVVRRGSGTRVNVRLKLSDGSWRFVDVFTAHWVEGILYIPSDTGFALPREAVLPLRPVTLHGREVPGPADPERILAATYGEGWRVPDPSFKYVTPRWLARRLGGWFGGLKTGRKHWDAFYGNKAPGVPREPSPFARWVAETYPSSRPLVDLGSGNGRDAVFFAHEQGRPVTALDYSVQAAPLARRLARRHGVALTAGAINLYDLREVLSYGVRLSRCDEPADLYARFTMHSLNTVGRENLLRLASMALRRGGLLFCEFRTDEDAELPHVFGEHRRYYLDPADVVAQVQAAGGRVLSRQTGTGLARLRSEDPVLCRLVASWSDQGS